MTILSSRGVPDDVFVELQQEAVREELKVIGDVDGWWDNGSFSRAGVNGRMRLAGALETYGGLAMAVKKRDAAGAARGLGVWKGWGDDREDEDDSLHPQSNQGSQRWGMSRQSSQDSTQSSSAGASSAAHSAEVDIWRRDGISGYPPLKHEALRLAVLHGIDIARSNHFSDLWTYTVQDVIRGVVLNMHLPVARSAGGFLQPGIYAAIVFSRLRLTHYSCLQIGLVLCRRGKSCSFPLKRLSIPRLDSYPLQLLVKSWYVLDIHTTPFSTSFRLGWSTSRTSAYGHAQSKLVAVVSSSVPQSPSGSRDRPTPTTSSLPGSDRVFNQRGSTFGRYPLRWRYVYHLMWSDTH